MNREALIDRALVEVFEPARRAISSDYTSRAALYALDAWTDVIDLVGTYNDRELAHRQQTRRSNRLPALDHVVVCEVPNTNRFHPDTHVKPLLRLQVWLNRSEMLPPSASTARTFMQQQIADATKLMWKATLLDPDRTLTQAAQMLRAAVAATRFADLPEVPDERWEDNVSGQLLEAASLLDRQDRWVRKTDQERVRTALAMCGAVEDKLRSS